MKRKEKKNMLQVRKNTTLTGNSYVEDATTNQRINVIYMSASISDDGSNISINKTIQDKAAYLANKETCDLDMEEFEEQAFGLIK